MVSMTTIWDRTTAFLLGALGVVVPIALALIFVPVAIKLGLEPLLMKIGQAPRLAALAVFWAIELLGSLAIMALAIDAVAGSGDAVRAAVPRWGPAILISGLLLAIAVLFLIPAVAVLHSAGVDLASLQLGHATGMAPGMTPGVGLFVSLYLIVFMVAMFWLVARLLPLDAVIFAERRGLRAITRSFALTRGLALRIVGVMLLYWIVSGIATLAAQTVFGSILRLVVGGHGTITVASVLTALIVAAVSTVFSVLAAGFIANLYLATRDLPERRVESV